jgi:hypothetical protein
MRPVSIVGVMATVVSALMLVGSATATGVDTRTPFAEDVFNPCTGELVAATGFVHTTFDSTVATDGSVHQRAHVNLVDMAATGLVTGARYVVQREINEGMNADFDAMPSTQNFIFKEHYVRVGEGGALVDDDDFYLYFKFQLTINAQGNITVSRLATPTDECN